MSIGSQVSQAMRHLSEGRHEDGVIAASVALAATARREYPASRDRDACHRFIEGNVSIISRIGWVAFGVSAPMRFRYRRLDGRGGAPVRSRSTSEMLYDVVRCTAVHEARLPPNLRFTALPTIVIGMDGELVLPIDVILGMLMAIVASPVNRDEQIPGAPVFAFGGKRIPVIDLLGNRQALSEFIGLA